jgi:SAM-dependent methyltransferase
MKSAVPLVTPDVKARVQQFWDHKPCGVKNATVVPGSVEFFRIVERHRYEEEFHIPEIAEFADHGGHRVLEIGGGAGTDGRQFARRGARYVDADLSRASLELARQGFRHERLAGAFLHADGEHLPFGTDAFDLVYSHGVLHHTPDTAGAIGQVWRVLKPGGKAIIMLYARDSFGYVAFHVVGRLRLEWTRFRLGRQKFNALMGLPEGFRGWLPTPVIVNNSTDGIGNPLSQVFTPAELRELFRQFREVTLAKRYFPRRKIPLVGPHLPPGLVQWLGRTMGSYWYVKAVK